MRFGEVWWNLGEFWRSYGGLKVVAMEVFVGV